MKGIHQNFNYEHFENAPESKSSPNQDFIPNQQTNFTNFMVFENSFTPEELNKIIELGRLSKKEKGKVPNVVDLTYRSSNIAWIPYTSKNMWIYDRINKVINYANKKSWNFEISDKHESIQYGEYNSYEKGHYDWHLDISNKHNIRKISVSVQLSDPSEYQGGELQFLTNRAKRTAPKSKGSIIVFPSYLLHKVTPVTNGKRMSLVMWRHGPCFK